MALVLSPSMNRRGCIWRCYASNIQAKCKELGWRMAVLVLELREKSIKDSQACGACTGSWVTKGKLPVTWWRNYWWMKKRTGLRGNCVRRTETGQHLWVAIKIQFWHSRNLSFRFSYCSTIQKLFVIKKTVLSTHHCFEDMLLNFFF